MIDCTIHWRRIFEAEMRDTYNAEFTEWLKSVGEKVTDKKVLGGWTVYTMPEEEFLILNLKFGQSFIIIKVELNSDGDIIDEV